MVMLSAGTLVSDVIILETLQAIALGCIHHIFLAPGTGERVFAGCWLFSVVPIKLSSVDACEVASHCRSVDDGPCSVGPRGCLLRREGTLVHSFLPPLFLLSVTGRNLSLERSIFFFQHGYFRLTFLDTSCEFHLLAMLAPVGGDGLQPYPSCPSTASR